MTIYISHIIELTSRALVTVFGGVLIYLGLRGREIVFGRAADGLGGKPLAEAV
jgi:hypothetical protein